MISLAYFFITKAGEKDTNIGCNNFNLPRPSVPSDLRQAMRIIVTIRELIFAELILRELIFALLGVYREN